MSTYKWKPQNISITLIRSSQNATDKYKNYHILNWEKLALGGVKSVVVGGEHLTLFEHESAVLMSKEIDSEIRTADG